MAVVPWTFESGWLESRTLAEAYSIKIEITFQETTAAAWASGLAAPNFAAIAGNSAVAGDFSVWSLPKIPRVSSPDVGAGGAASLSISAQNRFVGSDGVDVASGSLVAGRWYKNVGYAKVTHDGTDYSAGQYFQAANANYTTTGTGTVERYHSVWDILNINQDYVGTYTPHVRISTKAYGGAYVVRFWGVVDFKSLELSVSDIDDPEDWEVQCKVIDGLSQLSDRTSNEYMEAKLLHSAYDYDVPGTSIYLTGVSTYTDGSETWQPGAYQLYQFVLPKRQDSDGDTWLNANNLRWIKLTDIFDTISSYLGYEAAVNNGAAWSNFHSWKFYYNTADSKDSGGTTLVESGIDDLWIISQVNNGGAINEQLTFFDPNAETDYSLKKTPSPLEILKKICVSFGLTFRTKINSSGQRYIEVIECARETATVTITDYSDIESGFKLIPNELAVDGIKIPSYGGGSDATRGNGESQNSVQFDQLFTLANNFRGQYECKRSAKSSVAYRPFNHRPGPDFFCSLWTLTGITGKTATAAYSICAVVPRSNGNDQTTDPGNIPDWGEWDATLGAVIYPPTATPAGPQYWLYVEVLAWALCHYMYNDVPLSVDPVGFVRPRGTRIEFSKLSIDHSTVLEPPFRVDMTIGGTAYEFLCTEAEEDLENDIVAIKGHTRTIV